MSSPVRTMLVAVGLRSTSPLDVAESSGADVVAMFRPNLATWRHDPVFADHPADLDALDAAVAAQVDRRPGAITWRLRQLVWERPRATDRPL